MAMNFRLVSLAVWPALVAVSLWFNSACSRSGGVVEWPALKEMDEWAEKGEGWAEDNKIAEMRQGLPGLKAAAEKLVASPVPANAKDTAAVAQTMNDFKDVLKHLNKPNLSDEDLKTSVAAVHPLVEKLMGVAGLPHVHEHPDKDEKK
jgi:hypothetical protein